MGAPAFWKERDRSHGRSLETPPHRSPAAAPDYLLVDRRIQAEFLARGLEGWPDHKVLELLLCYAIPQGDVNGLAHELVERFGSLAGALDASVEELKKVPGVGEHTAVLLRMLPALLGRYQGSRARLAAVINWPEDAYAWLEPYFFGARNEMVYVLCLSLIHI